MCYYTVFSVTSLELDKHVLRVGGYTSKLERLCLLAGRKRVDGDKPEAMTVHSFSPRGCCLPTGCSLVILFSMIPAATLLFTSSGQTQSLSLLLDTTVYPGPGLFVISCRFITT